MKRWEPDFDFYEARFDETRAALFCDLAAVAHAPVAGHPLRLMVRVAMVHPRADGLRSEHEAEVLFAAEDAIVERLGSLLDAIYVGRVVAEGYATFAFYVPRARAEDADRPAALIGNLSPYEPEWVLAEDAEWAYYREFLYPDPESHKLMMSRRASDRITGVGQT